MLTYLLGMGALEWCFREVRRLGSHSEKTGLAAGRETECAAARRVLSDPLRKNGMSYSSSENGNTWAHLRPFRK